MARLFLLLAAFAGFTSVALGAFAAHGLRQQLSAEYLAVFQTGVQYQQLHTLALLAVALLLQRQACRLLTLSGGFFVAGMLLFSVTGLTWSQWAGGNVDKMRAAFGWMTPQVNTQLHGPAQAADPHAEHHGHHHGMEMPASVEDSVQFDEVLQVARAAGINAAKLEIRPPRDANSAWTVTEIDRSWPTQVDAVAVDANTMQVIDSTRFEDFPLMAKLTRWGVDFHMGVLFGLPNQLVLIAFGLGLCVMIVMGYRLWWLRRPAGANVSPVQTLVQSWLALPVAGRIVVSVVALLLALALPVLGVSLLLFLAVDVLRWRKACARRPVAE